MTGWFRRNVVVAGAVAVLGAAGCSGSEQGPVDPPIPSATSSTASVAPTGSPTGTVEEQILAQYRRFWTEALPELFAAKAAKRPKLLREVVMDPLLPELLRVARELDRRNQESIGPTGLIDQSISRKGNNATVQGCLDMSAVLVIDRTTGKTVHQGGAREVTQTRLRVGSDGIWRVYSLNNPVEQRC